MGSFARGRTVLPPQVQQQTHLQPTPVPSDRIFQWVFSSQVMHGSVQREDTTVSRAPGSLQGTDPTMMATAFGQGIAVLLVSSRGQQSLMDMSAVGPALLGGLQLAQMMTPSDRLILNLPGEPAITLQIPDSRVTYDPNTQVYTYYGPDAVHAITVLPQMLTTDWARGLHNT